VLTGNGLKDEYSNYTHQSFFKQGVEPAIKQWLKRWDYSWFGIVLDLLNRLERQIKALSLISGSRGTMTVRSRRSLSLLTEVKSMEHPPMANDVTAASTRV